MLQLMICNALSSTCSSLGSEPHEPLLYACFRLLGTIAGDYGLSITNSQGDALRGSPFAICARPGLISAAHSSFELLPSTTSVAGSEVQLKLNASDLFGNQVSR